MLWLFFTVKYLLFSFVAFTWLFSFQFSEVLCSSLLACALSMLKIGGSILGLGARGGRIILSKLKLKGPRRGSSERQIRSWPHVAQIPPSPTQGIREWAPNLSATEAHLRRATNHLVIITNTPSLIYSTLIHNTVFE